MFHIPCDKIRLFFGKSDFVKNCIIWVRKFKIRMSSPYTNTLLDCSHHTIDLLFGKTEFFAA